MAVDLVVASLDGMAEALASEYKQAADGSYVLETAKGVGTLEVADAAKVSGALGKLRTERDAFKAQLKGWEGLKTTPDNVTKQLAAYDTLKNTDVDAATEARVKAVRDDLTAQHTAQISAKDAANTKLSGQLESVLRDGQLTTELTTAGAGTRGAMALPHLSKHVRMREDSAGNMVSEVVDAEGNPRYEGLNGDAMTVKMLVEEFKGSDAGSIFFNGSASSGGGSGGQSGESKDSSRQSGGGDGKVITIPASDQSAVNANVQGIADGTVIVDMSK